MKDWPKPGSRSARIIAAANEGVSGPVIAEREQVGENYVNQVRKRARDRGLLVGPSRVNWRTVPVPAAAQAAFARAAERRGVAVDTLIGALLTAIAEDDLFAAVLDTAER